MVWWGGGGWIDNAVRRARWEIDIVPWIAVSRDSVVSSR